MSEHSTEWVATTLEPNRFTGQLQPVTHRVIELASGQNYRDEQGQWQTTQELFELTPRGAVARFGPHKVILAPNLNTAGAVDILTPDGQRLRLHLVGLSYYDSQSGQSVLLDEVADSEAELLPPNQILFRSAFTEIDATVRYTYTKGGLAQDVILHEQPPAPELFGLSNEHSRLEVLSEMTADTPLPQVDRCVLASVADPAQRGRMVAPDLTDDTLAFGSMRMGPGRAFTLPEGEIQEVPVGKRFEVIEGRRILFESVPWPNIQPWVNRLPRRNAAVDPIGTVQRMAGGRVLPRRLLAKSSMDASGLRMAQTAPTAGVVLDYDLAGTLANFVFTNGVTFCASAVVNFTGTTVFQDAIVKFAPGARLNILGPMVFQTDLYAPTIFTARDDNTVGEPAPNSDGNPAGEWFADPVLNIYGFSAAAMIQHVKFAYAKKAVSVSGVPANQKHEVRHAQLVQCGAGFNLNVTEFALRNVLMHGVLTNFLGMYAIARLEHVTIRNSDWLNYNGACTTLALTNCILAGVTNALGSYIGVNNHVAATEEGLFVEAGAGANYLPYDSALREAGTTSIHAGLLTELQQRTVDAPWDPVFEVTADTTLVPQVFGDSGTPDLGYHYPIVDYAFGSLPVQGATLTLTNGVTVMVYGNAGVWLQAGAHLVSEGSPLKPNRFVRYVAVQEQPANWGEATPGALVMLDPYASGASPSIQCRFTEIRLLDGGWHTYADGVDWTFSNLTLRDCRLTGGALMAVGNTGATLDLFNTVFEGVRTELDGAWGLSAYHNLFRQGVLILWQDGGNWIFRDNVFEGASLDQLVGPTSHDHNAYVGMSTRLSPEQASDKILASLAWQTGTLGTNYLPAGSTLLNQGSRTASTAGLFHYTTATNQTPEGASQVDIGLHYLALAGGLPIDTDGDGLADYQEDANGNGAADAGERAFNLWDTDYDGRSDAQEAAEGTNPVDPSSATPTRLGWWRFDASDWHGEQGQLPKETPYGVSRPAGWSGTVLEVPATPVANLKYRDEEANHTPNINARRGSIRLWFKPTWSSGAGQGPGTYARLIEMGNNQAASAWWALSFDATGQHLAFAAHAPGGQTVQYLSAAVSLSANQWHEIVLTYGPSATALYLNGELMGTGSAVTVWPDATTRAAYGFSIGSSRTGTEPIKGQIDELETFNYELAQPDIAAHYEGMIEPPEFGVTTESDHIRVSTVNLAIDGGPSARLAVMIDSTDFDQAVWGPFHPAFAVPLGTGDGRRNVYVGLSGVPATTPSVWRCLAITVDTTPPTVSFTSPAQQSTTSQPEVQILGGANEELLRVTYDLTNAEGTQTGLSAHVIDWAFDPDTLAVTSAQFQCFDTHLATGSNQITVHAEDPAGNVGTATLTVNHSFAGDSTAPVITRLWPENGRKIAGESFTIRGTLDDPTATITASLPVSGQTVVVEGQVERDGRFWIEDVPLPAGLSTVTLAAVDAAGNPTSPSPTFQVERSGVTLTIVPPGTDPATTDFPASSVNVGGTISDSAYAVWVNGVEAAVANGAWTATGVPIVAEGTFTLTARAYPPGQHPTQPSGTLYVNPACATATDQDATVDMEPRIILKQYVLVSLVDRRERFPEFVFPCDQPTETTVIDWVTGETSTYYRASDYSRGEEQCPAPKLHEFVTTWGPEGNGTQQKFEDQNLVYTWTDIPRLPSLDHGLYFEECSYFREKYTFTPERETYTRGVIHRAQLWTGERLSKKEKSFKVIHCTAAQVPGARDVMFDPPNWSCDSSHLEAIASLPVDRHRVKVNGLPLDCYDNIFARFPNNKMVPLVVSAEPQHSQWTVFNVSLGAMTKVVMSRAYHPIIATQVGAVGKLQDLFNEASVFLGEDRDGDAGADHPAYVDFTIVDHGCFPQQFTASRYCYNVPVVEVNELLDAGFADIVQVNNLASVWDSEGREFQVGGRGRRPSSPARIVLARKADSHVAAHEYGHTRDLEDRHDVLHALMYYIRRGGTDTDWFTTTRFDPTRNP